MSLTSKCIFKECDRKDTRYAHWAWWCPDHIPDVTPDTACSHSEQTDNVCSYCGGEGV